MEQEQETKTYPIRNGLAGISNQSSMKTKIYGRKPLLSPFWWIWKWRNETIINSNIVTFERKVDVVKVYNKAKNSIATRDTGGVRMVLDSLPRETSIGI